ncbi:MAG: glycosyltransferase family 9 protein [Bacteroidales bacterium]|nr:glycosyltransferase family 9 protein [Bacteroidales bacterium]
MVERLLVVRLSAMGDVAMTVPVVAELASSNPKMKITVLSRDFLRPMFEKLPDNVEFISFDAKGRHKGFSGLNLLYKELKSCGFTAVADLHDVLRTKYLRMRFALSGVKVAHIDKGRAEKKALVKHEIFKQLKPTVERYREVFEKLGLNLSNNFISIFNGTKVSINHLCEPLGLEQPKQEGEHWIGIAPFAAHKGKAYPVNRMQKCVEQLAMKQGYRVFCFGAGQAETSVLSEWSAPNVHCVAGKLRLKQELELMSNLDVMVSMDSANMHLASLVNVPVVSVWGATHPYAGFMGWGQSTDNAVQLDMPCRPCSIYGNKPCTQSSEFECLNIDPSVVVQRVESIINR